MKLSPEQQTELKKKLLEKLKPGFACYACGHSNWIIESNVYEFREFHQGNFVLGGNSPIIPTVPMFCGNCGFIHLLNPMILGLKLSSDESNGNT